jgi:hypothetical protein
MRRSDMNTIDELLWLRSEAVDSREVAAREIWRIEGIIRDTMIAEGIEDLGHPEWEVTCKQGVSTYDKARLMAELPELVPPTEYAKGYTAAWVEHREIPHEADLNMTQVKPWRRFSKQVRDLIDNECRTPGEPVLKIRRNKSND